MKPIKVKGKWQKDAIKELRRRVSYTSPIKDNMKNRIIMDREEETMMLIGTLQLPHTEEEHNHYKSEWLFLDEKTKEWKEWDDINK